MLYLCFPQVIDVSKKISEVPEWFKGSRLNYAENLLKHKDQDKVALYATSMFSFLFVQKPDSDSDNEPKLWWYSVMPY